MYNGVGLPTARGSGTSGRVQSNKFLLRPRPSPSSSGAPATSSVPGGGIREEMAEHERRRALESRLLELREALEEQGYTEAETDARVAKAAAEEAERSAAKEELGGGGCWPKRGRLSRVGFFSRPQPRPSAVGTNKRRGSLKKPAVISRWNNFQLLLYCLVFISLCFYLYQHQ